MSKKITAAAMPPLQLTPQHELELRQLSAALQQEVLAHYEQFLFRDQRCLDATRWKHARTDGELYGYRERPVTPQPHQDDKHTYAYPPRKQLDAKPIHGPQQKLAEQSPLPRLLVTGTLSGSVDDIMYGSSYQDTASLQGYWASQGDRIEESAVLAKLEGATIEDPYAFLGVTWVLRTFPLNVRQRRDALTLSSIGTTQLSNGERVGFFLAHSIQHRDLGELHEFNTIRGTASLLMVVRQFDVNRIEVFMMFFLDAKGSMQESAHMQESFRHLMPLPAAANNAGFRKKLEWLMQRRAEDHHSATPCDAIEPQSSGTNDFCELCDKTLGKLFSCPGTSCQLCYRRICYRCSMSQELAVATAGSKTMLRPHDLCMQCVLEARAKCTLTVALEEAQHRQSSTGTKRERVRTVLLSDEALLYAA